MQHSNKIVVIGGSAGCLPPLLQILLGLPAGFAIPVVVVLHRMKNAQGDMDKIINIGGKGIQVREPDDKEAIVAGNIYMAPANYHILAEKDKTFSYDYSEPVQYSRPSIDVAFESFAAVYGAGVVAVLLSGANQDGAAGLTNVLKQGGVAIVQHPATCEYTAMPQAAINKNASVIIYTPMQILQYLQNLQLH